jgi:hypothetical protein
MKKIIALLMLLVSLATANAKGCDWSSLKLQQWNERNVYKWYVSGKVLDDTCVDYMFMVYDFQTKKTDTVYDVRGIVEVQFNVKGRYKLYLKVWDRCKKCDTALYRPIEIVQFPGAGLGWVVNSLNCKKYKFEMNYVKGMSVKDTCMDYYMVFYKGPWMDTMSQKEWDNLTDYQIGMEYEFPDADFLGYTQTRLADFTFKDSGRVLMYAQWWNKCLRQDTFMFRRLDVCKRTNSSEVKEVVKLEPMIVPNPADGGFIISMSGVTQYEVVDMNGRIVLKGEYREGDIISTENLKEGLYYVKTNRSLQPIVIKH